MTQTDQMLIDQFNTGDMAQHGNNSVDILQLLAGTEATTDSGSAANVWASLSPSVPDYSYPALSPAPQPHAGPNRVQYLPAHTYPYPPPNIRHPIQYQYPMPTDHPPPNVHHPIQYQYPTPTDHPSVSQAYHPYPGYAYDGPHGPPIPTYVYVPPQTTQAPPIGRISQMYMPYSPRTRPQGSARPFSGSQAKNIASSSQPSNFRTTNLAGGTHPSSFCDLNLAGTQAPSGFHTTNLTGISHLSSFATTSAQPPQPDRPSKSSMTGDKGKANDAHSSFIDHGTGDDANEVIISDSSFVDHSFKTRTETSGKSDASDPASLKHYLANGWVNWHLVLKSSQRLAYEDLINNILLELTDNWARGLIDHATYMHRKTPVEAGQLAYIAIAQYAFLLIDNITTDCAISPQMLQGIKRYFRRALKADKKKIDAIVMSPEGASLSLAGCDEVELQRRVGIWLGPIHEQYLHVRGENVSFIDILLKITYIYLQGAIQIPFGRAVVRKGVEAIGYGTRGSDMPIGMGWNKRTGAPVSVFAYVGNLVSCILFLISRLSLMFRQDAFQPHGSPDRQTPGNQV
jgi:hypothetical protein